MLDFLATGLPVFMLDGKDAKGAKDKDKSADDGGKDKDQKLTISDENTELLKAVGAGVTDFGSQKALDKAIDIAKKGASFKGKVQDAEKETKDYKEKIRKLQAIDLVDKDGNVNEEARKNLESRAARSEILEGMFSDLAESGHLTEKGLEVLLMQDSNEAKAFLKYLPAHEAKTGFSQEELDAAVDEKLKSKELEKDAQGGGGGGGGGKSNAELLKEKTASNNESYFGDRGRKPVKQE